MTEQNTENQAPLGREASDLTRLLSCLPEGYAIVDMRALENDLMMKYDVHGGRFPSTREMNNRQRLSAFVDLTQKYIISAAR